MIRGVFLIAIYGISCSYSFQLYRLATGFQDTYGKISPQSRPDENDKAYETQKFEQKVNHFDKKDTRKWTQYYYKEDKYYQNGGPVYLWIEGTELVSPFRLKSGYWVSHAKKHNAMLFLIDHRFHYFAQPLNNVSTENLAYLSVPQALSDYAEFIKEMNELNSFPKNTKWMVFGSYYSGNLAAWMRTKYPNLVHGAVASSAPVLAQMDIPEFLDNVGGTIEAFNKKCKADIALANQKLDELAKTENGRNEIGDTFTLCDALDGNKLSTSVLMDHMASYISLDIQYDLENKKVKKMCNTMLKDAATKTPVQRYSQLMNKYMKAYNRECLNSNFDFEINWLRKVDMYSSMMAGRSWLYQMCTEFGWFQISGKKSSTFSKNIDSEFYVQLCSKAFKPSFDKKFISQAVEKTNKSYGGLKLNTPRTLFVHGSSDPWRTFGITSTKNNKKVDVIIIKGGSHATDTDFRHTNSKNVNRKKAIQKIMTTLDSWLKK